tara:strand:+ start:315 stop:1286 length:972 start_codon:yes stop_codon:yes gene_type:complete
MGTKGSKNTPITARISTGLFNQKKGVKEPLLDVGPAGVSGNNQTRDIPSPSKMRGYSMKASPFKQTKVGVNVVKSDSTGDQIIKGKKITRGKSWDDLRAEGMSEEKITEAKAWRKKNPNGARDQVDTGESEPDTIIKGETKESNKFTANKTRDKGDSQTALDRRNVIRSGKIGARTAKDAQRKTDRGLRRSGAINPDTNKPYNKRDQRIARNATQDATNLKISQNVVRGVINQTDQNIGINSNKDVLNEERNMQLSGVGGKDKQDTVIKEGGVPDSNPIDFLAMGNTTATDNKKLLVDGPSGAKKKTPDFFKKKSPLKMKYFK